MRIRTLGAALVATMLAGCTTQIGHATLLSDKSLDGIPAPVAHSVEGEDCQIQWSINLQPKLQKAMSRALDQAKGANALANTSIYYQKQYWVLFYRNCLRIEGDAVALESVKGRDRE